MIVPSKELTRAAGINQTIQSLCGIVAPVIGAALITVMSIENILLIDVAGAAVAISSLFFVHIPDPEKQDKVPDLWGEIKECFDVIRSRRGLPYIFFCSMIINLAIAPVAVLFPLVTVSHFGGDAYQMSIVEMLWGVGAFAGGLVMGARRIKSNYMVLINIVNTILGLYLIVSGVLSPQHFVVFAVITAFGGLCCAVFNALFTAILQKSIDHAVLGRVFSLFFSITMLPSVLGIVGSGFLADTIGISQTFFYSGIMIALMGLVSFLVPSAMRLGNDCRKL